MVLANATRRSPKVVAVRLSGKVWEAAVREPPPEAPS
jgi:hypothetical protein